MDYLELLKASKAKKLDNAYILINREDYLYDHTLDRIAKDQLDENFLAFNYTVLDGDSATFDMIHGALLTLPMMSEIKINVINHLDQVALSEAQLDTLIRLALDSVGVLNLFTFSQKKSKAYNRLKKEKVEIVEFKKLSDAHFRKWVVKRFREKGKPIDAQALQFFISYSLYGDRNQAISLYHMENEIEKIVSLSEATVTVESLRRVMIMPLEMNIFSLTDHLAAGELKASYEKLDELMAKGHSVYELMPLLTKTYHNMAVGKVLSDKGYPLDAIRDVLGFKSDYPVRMLLKRSARFKGCDLTRALDTCLSFESALKSRSLDPRIHLENLILRLAQ